MKNTGDQNLWLNCIYTIELFISVKKLLGVKIFDLSFLWKNIHHVMKTINYFT